MRNENPKVSIIVPNYNYENYLGQRIDSILNQTYTDYELILLDDASTDNSAEVIKRYKDNAHVSRIEINAQNTGSPFKQWMKGILLARGEWIWIAEADDTSAPTFLENCMRQIGKHPDTSICFADSQFIDEHNRYIRSKKPIANDGCSVFDGEQFAEHFLYWENAVVNASGVIFRKEYALRLENAPFFRMRYCGDWLFWFELSRMGKVVNIHERLNFFRQHLSQTAKGIRNGQNLIESMQVTEYIENQLHIVRNKRRHCHGRLARTIRHIKDKGVKQRVSLAYRQQFHSSLRLDYYLYKLRLHFRFLPWMLTEEKDKQLPATPRSVLVERQAVSFHGGQERQNAFQPLV